MRTPPLFIVLLALLACPWSLLAQPSVPGDGGGTNGPAGASAPSYGRTILDLQIKHVGTLRLELFDREKPATVKNFLNYIFSEGYSNSFIHRASSNFVVQGGSLKVIEFGGGSKAVGPVGSEFTVTNEMGRGVIFGNLKGTIALAHEHGLTNDASSHWFINLADNASLDANTTNAAYTVFGRVISSLADLDKLNPASTNAMIHTVNVDTILDELPVLPAVTAQNISYEDLLTTTYTIVTLDMGLTVQVQTNGTKLLSWQSLTNRTHKLRAMPEIGGTWTNLWTTNGDGTVQIFTDSLTNAMRFYQLSYE